MAAYLAYQNQELQKQLARTNQNQQQDNSIAPTPTPNPTTDWETYINDGFSFKYPSTWQMESPKNTDDPNTYIYSNDIVDVTGPEDIKYYLYFSQTKNLISEATVFTPINGYKTYKTDQIPSRSGTLTYFITKDNTNYVSISLTPFNNESPFPEQDKYLETFDRILSTFKFID